MSIAKIKATCESEEPKKSSILKSASANLKWSDFKNEQIIKYVSQHYKCRIEILPTKLLSLYEWRLPETGNKKEVNTSEADEAELALRLLRQIVEQETYTRATTDVQQELLPVILRLFRNISKFYKIKDIKNLYDRGIPPNQLISLQDMLARYLTALKAEGMNVHMIADSLRGTMEKIDTFKAVFEITAQVLDESDMDNFKPDPLRLEFEYTLDQMRELREELRQSHRTIAEPDFTFKVIEEIAQQMSELNAIFGNEPSVAAEVKPNSLTDIDELYSHLRELKIFLLYTLDAPSFKQAITKLIDIYGVLRNTLKEQNDTEKLDQIDESMFVFFDNYRKTKDTTLFNPLSDLTLLYKEQVSAKGEIDDLRKGWTEEKGQDLADRQQRHSVYSANRFDALSKLSELMDANKSLYLPEHRSVSTQQAVAPTPTSGNIWSFRLRMLAAAIFTIVAVVALACVLMALHALTGGLSSVAVAVGGTLLLKTTPVAMFVGSLAVSGVSGVIATSFFQAARKSLDDGAATPSLNQGRTEIK